jgi:hypothetical protein
MEELMYLPNCRAAFHQLMLGCVFYAAPKLSPPHPRLPRQLFSGSERPSPWKRPCTTAGRIGLESPYLDFPKYFSGGSTAWDPTSNQLPADTVMFPSGQLNGCYSHGELPL